MPQIAKHVTSGDYRTLETFIGVEATVRFIGPRGAHVKIRYGVGIFGKDAQKKTLNGDPTYLEISKYLSLSRARVQIKVSHTQDVSYYVESRGVAGTPSVPY